VVVVVLEVEVAAAAVKQNTIIFYSSSFCHNI
jgi:hypothetical protein